MNKEDYFIKQFKNSKFIGDDGAVIGRWVYSADAFFENVHFKVKWMSLKQIGMKAMLVNISDAIVMNAVPKYALLTVAIPSNFSKKDLKELASGFKKVAKQYNIKIIGGDTISNIKLDISVTIISVTKNPTLRTGTKKGDLVCFTGSLGKSKKDLEKLLLGKKVKKNSKFIKPQLNAEFFYEIAPYINSALDISDGLFFELERLSKANKIGFKFFQDIQSEVGCSGEEYEILFTFKKSAKKDIKRIAKKYKIKLNIFAKAIKGKYKCKCKGHHFE
ncbi:MAG: thiamine-phosphate kinase [Arcobacteraceae bacterium]|nr:thiamine-phosphate kinase [Arcobacteraceae bacterium]